MQENTSGAESILEMYSLASCLVEDEDVALAKERAGKTEELFLAVREVDLLDVGVEVALFLDCREKLHAFERVEDVLAGAGSCWICVDAHAAFEQE